MMKLQAKFGPRAGVWHQWSIWWNYLSNSKTVAWIRNVDCLCKVLKKGLSRCFSAVSSYAASLMHGRFTLASTHLHRQATTVAHLFSTRPPVLLRTKHRLCFSCKVRLSLAVSERGDPSRFLFSFFFYLLLLLLPLLFSSSPSELLCATLLADQLREKLCASLCLLMGDAVKLNKWAVRRWWQAADVVSLLSPPKTHTHTRLCGGSAT